MTRRMRTCGAVGFVVIAGGVANVQAGSRPVTLAVTMTNDPMSNQIKVYDVDHHVLLQTLSTRGQGGVGGNARGVKQYKGELFAAVNNGSVSAPADTLTPFGFAVYPDGTALITLAHSSQDGLFRNGAFAAVIDAGQMAPCWMTRTGKYVFTANTGSGTISRLIGTGNSVFVDSPVAASITTGGAPSDIDADRQVLGVIDHGGGASHLSLFSYNRFGELAPAGAPIDLGVANANGVAIMAPPDDQDGH